MTDVNILYIEDEEGQITLTRYALEDGNYNFTMDFARTGKEGIAVFDPVKHDLLMIDWNLPDMQAPEIVETILSKFDTHPPIVFLSGIYTEKHTAQAEALGVKACIEKSMINDNLNEVAEIVKEIQQQRTAS